jgi:predicted unusual protein kinase regulating ubiquinone biosynthesis (AarF/ABC1/UbiB family)
VKVQYPGIAEALEADLQGGALLRRLVGGTLGAQASPEALGALRAQLLSEVDYNAEARNLSRFSSLFTASAEIAVPQVIADRSSRRVLTMTRLEGRPLAALRSASEETRARVARAIFTFAFGTPLHHGMFNADPHPGNYVVGDRHVGFVDFGAVAELDETMQLAEHKLWLSLIHRNGEALRHAAHQAGLVARAEVFDTHAWRDFERALGAPFLRREAYTLEPAHAATLVEATTQLLATRQADLPPGALILWRQRLGAFRVLADLRPRLPFRRLLAELLDDGRNPICLYDRYP